MIFKWVCLYRSRKRNWLSRFDCMWKCVVWSGKDWMWVKMRRGEWASEGEGRKESKRATVKSFTTQHSEHSATHLISLTSWDFYVTIRQHLCTVTVSQFCYNILNAAHTRHSTHVNHATNKPMQRFKAKKNNDGAYPPPISQGSLVFCSSMAIS